MLDLLGRDGVDIGALRQRAIDDALMLRDAGADLRVLYDALGGANSAGDQLGYAPNYLWIVARGERALSRPLADALRRAFENL